jgi:hypothetical protein
MHTHMPECPREALTGSAMRIAQVHRGRMHDGRDIVVKVQHAGMEARRTHPTRTRSSPHTRAHTHRHTHVHTTQPAATI